MILFLLFLTLKCEANFPTDTFRIVSNCDSQFPTDTIRIDTVFWENGAIKQVAFYSDYWQFKHTNYFSNGKLHYEGFNYRQNSGRYISNLWDTNGIQKIVNGNGVYSDYHINGILKETGKVEYGIRGGIWQTYHSNGKKASEGSYTYPTIHFSNCKNGIWKFWHSSGQLANITEYANDFEYRYLEQWTENGKKMLFDGYGNLTEYYDNGSIKAQGPVWHGEKRGTWTHYYKNGNKLAIGILTCKWHQYSNDSLSRYNLQMAWDTSGEISFRNGNGFLKYYDHTGNLKYIQNYKNNVRDSIFIAFYENGQIEYKDLYENGELTDRIRFHINGTIASQSNKYWYVNGVLKSEREYLNDSTYFMTGYYKNGVKMFESKCEIEHIVHGFVTPDEYNCSCSTIFWNIEGKLVEGM